MTRAITLEPHALGVPGAGEGSPRAHEYIRSLTEWAGLQRQGEVEICTSLRTIECLHAMNHYPLAPRLRTLLAAHGIDYVDANTILRYANELFQSTPYFEERYGVKDVLFSSVSTNPPFPSAELSDDSREEAERLLVCVALLQALDEGQRLHRLATRGPLELGSSIELKAVVEYVEFSQGCRLPAPELPLTLACGVALCSSPSDYLESLDPVCLWTEAANSSDLELAIRCAALRMAREVGCDISWDATRNFRCGTQFEHGLARYGFRTDRAKIHRLLRSCAETVLGLNLEATHALREHEAGGGPQRRRGMDLAFRRDVDHEFHLHYWELPNQSREIACVGPHNLFDIPR